MREGWTYKKLGECFPYIKNGANIKQIKDAKGYPITRIETLSGGVFNRDRMGYADIFDINKFQDYLIEDGDLLMSHINSKTYIGRTVKYISKNNEKIIHGMNLLRLKSNESLILSSFFKFYTDSWHFKTDIARIRKDAVNQSSFAISDLKNFRIPLPSLSEQQAIVSELDKINELISLKKAQLSDVDALAQSIFYDMFGDPIENEKGWEVKNFGALCLKIANGYNAKLEEDTYKSEGIMYFRCQNVWRNRFDYSDLVYIDEETNKKMKSSSLKHNDFLITKIGRINTENSSLGRISLYEGEDNKANLSGNLCFARLKNNIANHKFILYILISNRFRDYIRRTTVGGIDKRALNVKQISSFPIILPPLSLQQEFAKRIELIEQQKAQISSTIKDLETLLASRMQYWFD